MQASVGPMSAESGSRRLERADKRSPERAEACLSVRTLCDSFALVTFGGGWNSRTGGEPEESNIFGEPATPRGIDPRVEPVKALCMSRSPAPTVRVRMGERKSWHGILSWISPAASPSAGVTR